MSVKDYTKRNKKSMLNYLSKESSKKENKNFILKKSPDSPLITKSKNKKLNKSHKFLNLMFITIIPSLMET